MAKLNENDTENMTLWDTYLGNDFDCNFKLEM